jgi:hypothetical protein
MLSRNARARPLHQFHLSSKAAIAATAAEIGRESAGRTNRETSLPSRRKINVGQSFTLNDRPSGRPRPSAILRWRTPACGASAAAMCGCAALQWPHHSVPNSITAAPLNASISARSGSLGLEMSLIGSSRVRHLTSPHLYSATVSTRPRSCVRRHLCAGGDNGYAKRRE